MGKRGPKPKGEYVDKSMVLSTRISAELRHKLEHSVKESGLTLSREVEHRLRRTFQEESWSSQVFGGQKNFRLMQLVGIAMSLGDGPARNDGDWIEDPALFEKVLRTVFFVLWPLKPPGSKIDFSTFSDQYRDDGADSIWHTIGKADASLPLGATREQHRANTIKSDLGKVAERATFDFNFWPVEAAPVVPTIPISDGSHVKARDRIARRAGEERRPKKAAAARGHK